MSEFFGMDGYAAYVWPSYAIAIAMLLLNVRWARQALRRAREEARRRIVMRAGGTAPQASTSPDGASSQESGPRP